MDLTFILSAAIFTLLAIVIATSFLNGASSKGTVANSQRCFGRGSSGGSEQAGPKQNGHIPDKKEKKAGAEDDWCDLSGSSHDHWDVVKSVLSEDTRALPEEQAAPADLSSSTSMSLDADTSSEASSGLSRRSFIGLSDQELLKCAFSHPQTEGAAESPDGINDLSNENDTLRYIPGKARSHHLQMMMSTEELEEEQRVQREQLAAIFQLLKENKETFGDVSEGGHGGAAPTVLHLKLHLFAILPLTVLQHL